MTTDKHEAYAGAEFVVVATPTNYDERTNYFDTSTVEQVVGDVVRDQPRRHRGHQVDRPGRATPRACASGWAPTNIVFSPEFLREGRALHDNLHPSRIVVGDQGPRGQRFADLLAEAALDDDVPVLLTDSTEAEAIKLFANTYLAMRVAFFNELDTYAAHPRARHPPDHRGRRASTRASARTTTTRRSATAATACPRTPSSCWPTTPTCRRP